MGLDPILTMPHNHSSQAALESADPDEAAGLDLYRFNRAVDAVSDHVPDVKPQFAYSNYMAYGLALCREPSPTPSRKALLFIADAKRNDIGSNRRGIRPAIRARPPRNPSASLSSEQIASP
jgi:hypothetical protein